MDIKFEGEFKDLSKLEEEDMNLEEHTGVDIPKLARQDKGRVCVIHPS